MSNVIPFKPCGGQGQDQIACQASDFFNETFFAVAERKGDMDTVATDAADSLVDYLQDLSEADRRKMVRLVFKELFSTVTWPKVTIRTPTHYEPDPPGMNPEL